MSKIKYKVVNGEIPEALVHIFLIEKYIIKYEKQYYVKFRNSIKGRAGPRFTKYYHSFLYK